MPDQDRLAPEPMKPFYNVLWILDAAAEQQQLRVSRRQGDRQFVVQSTVGITEHLVFIYDEQCRSVAADETILLRLERSHEDGCVEIFREITSSDSDIPAAGAPLGKFVIGQGAGRDRVDRLAAIFALIRPELENQSFTGARGRLD